MTESQWLAARSFADVWAFLKPPHYRRRLRLFAAACCRRVWNYLDESGRSAVRVAEQVADGIADERDRVIAWEEVEGHYLVGKWHQGNRAEEFATNAARRCCRADFPLFEASEVSEHVSTALTYCAVPHTFSDSFSDIYGYIPPAHHPDYSTSMANAAKVHFDLLRCIICNPFRDKSLPVMTELPHVRELAHAAYDERDLPAGTLDPVRLSILADALEESGTAGVAVDHLRGEGPHVRGCWVVERCLGIGVAAK